MNPAPLRLRWLEAASRDLNAIASYIANFSEFGAIHWLTTIDKRVVLLKAHPYSGEAFPRNRLFRRIFVGSYVLYYTVDESEVVIRGIIHGARRLSRSWLARRGKMKD
ncbi:MAG TPA: type II toxin-antitoxin system RelE/ParE family toxin [Pirellulaceae bacterium]|nr:type II toxin-antitoxin system RelE/ParE family toxin [Pirellulaceae bacterium]